MAVVVDAIARGGGYEGLQLVSMWGLLF
jgi:hypothetical protein